MSAGHSTGAVTGAGLAAIGSWRGGDAALDADALARAAARFREPAHVVRARDGGQGGVGLGGEAGPAGGDGLELLASLPPLYPEWLGDRSFCEGASRTRLAHAGRVLGTSRPRAAERPPASRWREPHGPP